MSTGNLRIFFMALTALLCASPARATFPGENGKIVFVSDRSESWQLYTIDPDGRNMTQITNLAKTDFDAWLPVFSPDGEQIVFCYASAEGVDIFTIKADGSGMKQLTRDGSACFPHWSPDGKYIAFARDFTPTHQPQITVIRSDGTGLRTTLTSGDFRFWGAVGPIYTPNGRELLFESQRGGLVSAAWIMASNGAHPIRFTPARLAAAAFDISPNGRDILLMNHLNSSLPTQLYIKERGEKEIRPITHVENVHDQAGSFSPDGKKIVFFSDRLHTPFSYDLFTMDADGSHIERIAAALGTCTDGNCIDPSWGSKASK